MDFWLGFVLLMITLLVVDFFVFEKSKKALTLKQAWAHSIFWISLALGFCCLVYYIFGYEKTLEFFTGYFIEKSLSFDNLFVFLIIFLHFRIAPADQKIILFWGILGALVFRFCLIAGGIALIENFHWTFYLFGIFLILSGMHFALQNPKRKWDPSKSLGFRFFQAVLPLEKERSRGKFFVKKRGKWMVTTLFIVLLLIEMSDILFALDSIPAIFSITEDEFIIYTSNFFAILGLRSLYFVIQASMMKIYYYRYGLAAILLFIGIKMILNHILPISLPVSLAVMAGILLITLIFSLKAKKVR